MYKEKQLFRILQDNRVPIEEYGNVNDEDFTIEGALLALFNESTQEENAFVIDVIRENGFELPSDLEDFEERLDAPEGEYGHCGSYEEYED